MHSNFRGRCCGIQNLAERASLDLKAATLVASTSGCMTLGDFGNTSEVQTGERTIHEIIDLDVPFVMGNRLREPIIKAIQEAAEVSWERKQKGSVEGEDFPLPSEELRYKMRIPADEDAGETVVTD